MNKLILLLSIICYGSAFGQEILITYDFPKIDMHLHSSWWGVPEIKEPLTGLKSYSNQTTHRDSTLAYLKRYNFVKAVTDGNFALDYQKRQPDLIMRAMSPKQYPPSDTLLTSLRNSFENGTYKLLAEFSPQYRGLGPTDDSLEPYFALAEEMDVPIGIHMGLGAPGAAYAGSPKYRMKLSNPLLIEDVLIKHPKLRIYIMHAGWPFIDELIGLLYAHPQVYIDVSVINWVLPRAEFHNYLKRIFEAGLGDRVMYGSDQMQWPQSIKISIENIVTADFLTDQQKKDVFYNNAAKFLQLSEEEMKKHKK